MWTWVAVAAFVGVQVAVITSERTGPFLDEGIYVTAGLRTLEGRGLADGYLTWFSGSLAWPAIAGIGYRAAGLVGTRLIALALVTTGVVAALQATANLYGHRARLLAALFLLTWGPLLSLAHLGVIDTLALAGLGVSLWAVTELAARDHRKWVVVAGLGLALGTVAKYPVAVFAAPLGLLVIALRGRKGVIDLVILALSLGALLQIFFLPIREQFALFPAWRAANDPDFGVTFPMVAANLAYTMLVPLLCALLGALVARRQASTVALLCGLLLVPAYHLLAANAVSANKHVVFATVFAAPLIGLAMSSAARGWVGGSATLALLAVLAALGVQQMHLLDRSWADLRLAADYLQVHVDPQDTLLVSNAWPYMPSLYANGNVTSPWNVYDPYRLAQGEQNLCDFDWFVEEEYGVAWPPEVHAEIEACNSFVPVHRSSSPVTNWTTELALVDYDVSATVWRNTATERS